MIFKNYFGRQTMKNNFYSSFSETSLSALKRLKRLLCCAQHFKCITTLLVFAGSFTNQLYFFEIYIDGINKS